MLITSASANITQRCRSVGLLMKVNPFTWGNLNAGGNDSDDKIEDINERLSCEVGLQPSGAIIRDICTNEYSVPHANNSLFLR